jgi:hypothetical protein
VAPNPTALSVWNLADTAPLWHARRNNRLTVESTGLDLRGRTTLSEAGNSSGAGQVLGENLSADIVIIGSGITGSFLAERLSRLECSIIVLDRNQPQMARTAASTALLLWAIDAPLRELAQRIGFAKATAVYRANYTAVAGILDLVRKLGTSSDCMPRPSLYLAGTEMGTVELAEEQRLRERAGMPSILISAKKILVALPKMAKAAENEELAAAFEKHRVETEEHVTAQPPSSNYTIRPNSGHTSFATTQSLQISRG